MRAVVQRVLEARVEVEGEVVGAIGRGILAYLGFGRGDTDDDRAWVLSKIASLRIFEAGGKMSLDVKEAGGSILAVSQFTLYGDVRRGRRPSFEEAMPPEEALAAYEAALRELRETGVPVESGRFRAEMRVFSVNDGPVTVWIDSAGRARRAP